MKEKSSKRRLLCKECQQVTWHAVLNEAKSDRSIEEAEIWEMTTFYTLQCLGCDNVCLLSEYVCSENISQEDGQPEVQSNIYPSPHKNDHEPMDKNYYLPSEVKSIYLESIKAFNSGLLILAAIGVRATIEAVAREQKITIRGIAKKIKKMVESNIITPDGAKLLMLVTDMGNLSAHELKKHHQDDLSLCIEVVESVLRNLYILPKSAEGMHGS
ncbi:hypothetical protein A2572_03330 [Candidatus Collierbacteria bacterium RIFOXYD1_FULL_40_9]|uniref:DUF4145 domain-containing protein n=1 Tax=Candidatus Collierbacteria bacterium RIFOXYD1_FULL_40_9 TaxID=1817731 RepID=A0A1F5FWX9_9BACT|nr:MAG: hypothetical protein A2572_03330 [Candidatus Collierbacteria bacterium RIFOXYD1_FULL_40_9]